MSYFDWSTDPNRFVPFDTARAQDVNTAFDAVTTAFADAEADIVAKAPLASPALTGNPTAPTQAPNDNSTKVATTAYVDTADALKAPLNSPALTGTPTAPTAASGTNTTQVATTQYVRTAIAGGYSGSISVIRETFTATAGQTLFNLSNTYTVGINAIQVYVNGAKMFPSDYTETSSSSITMASALALNDEVMVEYTLLATGTTQTAANTTFSPIVGNAATNVQQAIANSMGITQTVSATTATTLTSTGTVLSITPASYGVAVTLPDATTCAEGGPLHIIDNKGAYPVKVLNSVGTLIGFIYGGVVSHISLNDNSTAAGVWAVENSELVGVSAQLVTDKFSCLGSVGFNASVALDANREFVFGKDVTTNYPYGVIYDRSTNTFGTPVLLRTAAGAGSGNFYHHQAILAATDKILYVSVPTASTAMEAVILSVSGTTITVNTPATATLSANITAFAEGCGLIAVGASWVTSYTATGAAQIRALTVSGNTVTIGSATVLDGTAGGLMAASGSVVLVASNTAGNWWCAPYTISGVTITAGTGATTATGTTLHKFFPLGTRWVALTADGTNVYGHVVTLTGTVVTLSSVLVIANALTDAMVIGSNKVLCFNGTNTGNCNILTDTSGTASAGTAIAINLQNYNRNCLYLNGTNAFVHEGTTGQSIYKISCSGASPVVSEVIATGNISNTEIPLFNPSNAILQKAPTALYGTNYVRSINRANNTQNFAAVVANGVFSTKTPPTPNFAALSATTGANMCRGVSGSEAWATPSTTAVTTVLTKVELAVGALA